jgi:hypothetical protein
VVSTAPKVLQIILLEIRASPRPVKVQVVEVVEVHLVEARVLLKAQDGGR